MTKKILISLAGFNMIYCDLLIIRQWLTFLGHPVNCWLCNACPLRLVVYRSGNK